MQITRRGFIAIGSTFFALGARPALAKQPPVYTEGTVAIDGSDAVAYFDQGKPVAGQSALSFEWNGSTWLFSSAQNRQKFIDNPQAYAPQYGGYCAFAMSRGYVAPTVPEAWSIVDGKLYLNYSTEVRSRWKEDVAGNIAAADGNWPAALDN